MSNKASKPGRDWASRPSALFAASVLGIASLATMGVSLSRELRAQPAPQIAPAQSEPQLQHVPEIPRASAVRLINVNNAPLSELDLLPGIGPALGQRIIEYRNEHGVFERIDELQEVSGIGPRTLEKMKPLITLGDPNDT